MLALFATLLLQQTDTTVTVRPGSRLDLRHFQGTIQISAWNRSAIRLQADNEDDTEVGIEVTGNRVSIQPRGRYGPPEADLKLVVPADLELDISGHSGNVTVEGVKADVSIETIEGDITLRGGKGMVFLSSIDGVINVSDASGRIEVHATDGDVTGTRLSGEVEVESIDGAVILREMDATSLDVSSVDGDVTYEGPVRSEGRYRLGTHDGNVRLATPSLDANVSVSTFSGSFESDYPVTISGTTHSNRMNFTLGKGSARVELESFDGDVEIRKTVGRP
jgi:DUF4097 and DUF4098 domain-containing protein YvlB